MNSKVKSFSTHIGSSFTEKDQFITAIQAILRYCFAILHHNITCYQTKSQCEDFQLPMRSGTVLSASTAQRLPLRQVRPPYHRAFLLWAPRGCLRCWGSPYCSSPPLWQSLVY